MLKGGPGTAEKSSYKPQCEEKVHYGRVRRARLTIPNRLKWKRPGRMVGDIKDNLVHGNLLPKATLTNGKKNNTISCFQRQPVIIVIPASKSCKGNPEANIN